MNPWICYLWLYRRSDSTETYHIIHLPNDERCIYTSMDLYHYRVVIDSIQTCTVTDTCMHALSLSPSQLQYHLIKSLFHLSAKQLTPFSFPLRPTWAGLGGAILQGLGPQGGQPGCRTARFCTLLVSIFGGFTFLPLFRRLVLCYRACHVVRNEPIRTVRWALDSLRTVVRHQEGRKIERLLEQRRQHPCAMAW